MQIACALRVVPTHHISLYFLPQVPTSAFLVFVSYEDVVLVVVLMIPYVNTNPIFQLSAPGKASGFEMFARLSLVSVLFTLNNSSLFATNSGVICPSDVNPILNSGIPIGLLKLLLSHLERLGVGG